jgi:GT2 family glycosyltransferase
VSEHPHVSVSILIRTIGRPHLLRACLESLAACRPRGDEIVVVDQSRDDAVKEVVSDFESVGARVVSSTERGTGVAFNVGLRAVSHEHVLVTDDDCTVAPDWVGRAADLVSAYGDAIITGRVLAAGDPSAVPSVIDDPEPRDYTGEIHYGALYTNNCCLKRDAVLEIGGFDELIKPVAEDNDLCYRWLRAGRPLRYEPDLVVWHHEWRSRADLERWYVEYAKSQGMFYAKHLRRGDLRMLRYIAYDLFAGARGTAARLLLGRPRWSDAAQGILGGLPRGLSEGWRVFGANRGAGY